MLRNSKTLFNLFKALKLEPIRGDLNEFVTKIYEEYFQNKVLQSSNLQDCKSQNFQKILEEHTNQSNIITPTEDDVWIFGYGSLVWKADFPFIDRKRGFICGFQRRFYQNSIDHRGTHIKPGRVVTLLHTGLNTDRVYGIAYRIASKQKNDVLAHLDYREKNGYERCKLKFFEFPETNKSHLDIIMYIATHENESYAGDIWQLPCIAEQIFTSAGPSGSNRDYLFNLASVMRELFPGVNDEHLYELEKEVLHKIKYEQPKKLERIIKCKIIDILMKNRLENESDIQHTIDNLNEFVNSCVQPRCWVENLLASDIVQNEVVPNCFNGN